MMEEESISFPLCTESNSRSVDPQRKSRPIKLLLPLLFGSYDRGFLLTSLETFDYSIFLSSLSVYASKCWNWEIVWSIESNYITLHLDYRWVMMFTATLIVISQIALICKLESRRSLNLSTFSGDKVENPRWVGCWCFAISFGKRDRSGFAVWVSIKPTLAHLGTRNSLVASSQIRTRAILVHWKQLSRNCIIRECYHKRIRQRGQAVSLVILHIG
jgi:hypothetical protein